MSHLDPIPIIQNLGNHGNRNPNKSKGNSFVLNDKEMRTSLRNPTDYILQQFKPQELIDLCLCVKKS